jgi:hypothetical protein
MKLILVILFSLISSFCISQEIQAVYLKPQKQEVASFIKQKFEEGVKEGLVLDCQCKYKWTTGVDSSMPVITALHEPLESTDLEDWITYEFYNRRFRGKKTFCRYRIKYDELSKIIMPPKTKIAEAAHDYQRLSDYVKLQKIIPLKLPVFSSEVDKYPSAFIGNEFWLLHYEKSLNSFLHFLLINAKDYRIDTIKVKNPFPQEVFEKTSMIVMAVDTDYLCLAIGKEVFLFKRTGNQLLSPEYFNLETDIQYLSLHERKIFFGHCYNYSKEDEEHTALAGVFDINKRSLIQIPLNFILPELSIIVPNNWLDFKNGKILFSQSVIYKLNIISNDSTPLIEIESIDSTWKSVPEEIITNVSKLKGKNPEYSKYFYSVKPTIDKANRIREAYFISDSVIMIKIKLNAEEKLFYPGVTFFIDVWKLKDNSFVRTHEKLKEVSPKENVICSLNNYPLYADGTFYNISKFSNGKAAILKTDSNVYPIGKKYKWVERQLGSKYLSEKPGVNLYFYSVNF